LGWEEGGGRCSGSLIRSSGGRRPRGAGRPAPWWAASSCRTGPTSVSASCWGRRCGRRQRGRSVTRNPPRGLAPDASPRPWQTTSACQAIFLVPVMPPAGVCLGRRVGMCHSAVTENRDASRVAGVWTGSAADPGRPGSAAPPTATSFPPGRHRW
jgi:hypothetical protein